MLKTIKFTLLKVKEASGYLFYLYIFLFIIYSVLSFGTTLIFKEIVDTVNGSPTLFGFNIYGILIFKVCYDIFTGILYGVREYLLPVLKKRTSIHFLSELVDKTSELDIGSLEDPKTVGVISRAYSRIHFQFEFYFRNIIQLLASFIEIILALFIFYLISPIGALILFISNLIATIVKAKAGGANFNIYKADYGTRLKFGYATDLLNNRSTLLELKLFQNFNYIKNKILHIFNSFITKEIKQLKKNQIISNIVDLLTIIASFIFLLILASQMENGIITVGTFVFIFTNMLIFTGALSRFSFTLVSISGESNSIKDILEFYELKPKINSLSVRSNQELEEWKKKLSDPVIRYNNVSFKYPNASSNALTNINLTIPYSQNLAIVGENGAGKTTLIKLLLRVYDPNEGEITINDIDIKDIPIKALYTCFSTLFQNFGKFNLTIRENLEIASKKKLSDEEMIAFLKYANAWKFIETSKGVLDQQLGPEFEDGIDLSGGQWQSLAIARTYAKEAHIVILDEPTSSIDAKSEMEIFDRLNKKMRKETLIFISHRFSTIKDAERIVVIDKGKIVEEGTHRQLMENNKKYAQLYNIQFRRFLREEPHS